MRFKDKVVVVTGGASGIGLSAAQLFAQEGAIVGISDIVAGRADEAVANIKKGGAQAFALPGDVSDEEHVLSNARWVVERHGHIDVLVNAAGYMKFQPTETYSDWRSMMGANLDGSFYWARAAATLSMIPNRCGAIVNIGSGAGLAAVPGDIAYTVSKHAVVGLTRGLALEWAPFNIRVNCVCPGLIETPLYKEMDRADPPRYVARRQRVPMGRPGQPEEVARSIAFLASEESSYTTGLIMSVDGGQMALFSGNSPRMIQS